MSKIMIICDSSSDIPDEYLKEYSIEMVCVPITVDGKGYIERKSFTITEFYRILSKTNEIPLTSRVPMSDYITLYEKARLNGCTDVINVTVYAQGSGIYQSACMARDMFFADYPGCGMNIHVMDSRTYSMANGYAIIQAAKMVRAGSRAKEILTWLDDYYSRAEIYLVCYSMEYVRKSGRVPVAAAIVGDALGLRPVISIIDGKTAVAAKVRGDKQVPKKLAEIYKQRAKNPEDLLLFVNASDAYGLDVDEYFKDKLNIIRPHYKAGAAITINAGPKMAAYVLLGEKRGKDLD
jgi:DegV family protein with EDD domain